MSQPTPKAVLAILAMQKGDQGGPRTESEADRDLRPWRYYRFTEERLLEWLDAYATRFGPLHAPAATNERDDADRT